MPDYMTVGGERVEKWHMKPIDAEAGDRVRFTFKPPKADELREKTGTVERVYKDAHVRVDVDGAGMWRLKFGAVVIEQSGRRDRYNGSLADVEVEG